MAEDYEQEIQARVSVIFTDIVNPVMSDLFSEFNGRDSIHVEMVSDIPVIMGIKQHSSILFKLPTGVEHVVCVYWVQREENIVVENIRMVLLNRSFSIFDLSRQNLKKTIKALAGLGRYSSS